jgi:hypothetical protein
MADDTTAPVDTIQHVLRDRKGKTGAARAKAKAHRQHKRRGAKVVNAARATPASEEYLIPPEFLAADGTIEDPSVTVATADQEEALKPLPAMTIQQTNKAVTPKRRILAPAFLAVPVLVFTAVGITINGWLTRSLADQVTRRRDR